MNIQIRKANKQEINWINKKYDEVNFQHSDFNNEIIVLAEVNNKKAGVGRLIKIDKETVELGGIYVFEEFRGTGIASEIVSFLIKNKGEFNSVYCLPFENLRAFYEKHGFKTVSSKAKVPEKITQKHKWCNDTYDKKVLILSLKNKPQ